MKKILSLSIPIGLIAILLSVIFSAVRASDRSTGSLLSMEDKTKPEQAGPPWFNEAWHYRRPIIISNSGASLPYYQVLITLTSSNFDFSKANVDGSDVRFTHTDGTTELEYWIESWNNSEQLAYLWVRVPGLANGDTIIYLYYNNPVATALSDGTTTFDFFDDYWCQFPGAGCKLSRGIQSTQPSIFIENLREGVDFINPDQMTSDPWLIISGVPTVAASKLTLVDGTGIKTVNSYQYKAVGFRANYGLGAGKEWAGLINGSNGQRTMIGDLPDHVDDLYLIDHVTEDENILLPRVGGMNWHEDYHIYEVRWNSGASTGDVDHGASTAVATQPAQVPSVALPVTFDSDIGSNATLSVDWVYVRQYRFPEPTALLGVEQGLVDLAITKVDNPDPLYAGEALTYQLAITNTSNVDAPGVVVTDTLPGDVKLAVADPSQGDCIPDGEIILCNLNTISALSTASITIVVTTTMDGVIYNQANVGSPGYELHLSNNAAEASTTVTPSADLAINAQAHPEVLLPGSILTYLVTVTNQGPSEAVGVNMVDILPGPVAFIDTAPIDCGLNGLELSCPLGDLARSMVVQIVITATVQSTQTMNLIDSATTSSISTYDPNTTNNTTEISTLVDTTPPDVGWERPVNDGETYFTFGGTITLEASASDNDKVDHVNFLWYDHIHHLWISIGTEYTAPYQVPFDSNVLSLNELYQVFAQGYDRVGNNALERIFIERLYPYFIFMPLIDKR